MFLPEPLQRKTFVEWNYLVNGLVAVWEIACLLNLEEDLNFQLQCDHDARLAEMLGHLGNDRRVMDVILRHLLAANVDPVKAGNLCVMGRQSETLFAMLRRFSLEDPYMEPIVGELRSDPVSDTERTHMP